MGECSLSQGNMRRASNGHLLKSKTKIILSKIFKLPVKLSGEKIQNKHDIFDSSNNLTTFSILFIRDVFFCKYHFYLRCFSDSKSPLSVFHTW